MPAFVPFLGAVLAFAVIVVAVLYWMAGPRLRITAILFTIARDDAEFLRHKRVGR